MSLDADSDDLFAILARAKREMHVAFPAEVQSYDAAHGTVDVLPCLADWFPSEAGGVEQMFLPVLPAVPVLFPGGGSYAATFPIDVGSAVLIICADRSLDAWRNQGGRQAPADLRRHHLSDAVAVLGLVDGKHVAAAATDGATFGKTGGPQVKVTASEIRLGASATHPVIKGDDFFTALSTFLTAVNTFAGLNTSTGGTALGTAATALQTALNGYLSTLSRTA